MKMPLNASQTIAATAIAAVLLGGAFALGRSSQSTAPAEPVKEEQPAAVGSKLAANATEPAAEPAPRPVSSSHSKPAPAKQQQHQQQQQPVASTAAPAPRLCDECSRVVSVQSEERQGEGSGLGAIGGAVIGGLLGNQVGGGSGKKIATVGGAVAGGYAGNEIEKRHKSYRVWVVRLADRDGATRRHEQRQDPQVRAGDVVVVRDGLLRHRD
ncbi:glycine zipper 2TM domain-containing protein [Roseateles sp. DAIF2]|uniref:glycine zipper 2TM domain-containing protein n=1 Tax=Roseateles sp. DAIF2 TaxID=2714952 RepID=UPI0018A329FC|nr:glycine zipper 2TM domain-containing protein [Roseateles sp. DAIF2]QPF71948.1 glycine zipper 2TM domain-containing protein [Roseateles sp. DAIF2]